MTVIIGFFAVIMIVGFFVMVVSTCFLAIQLEVLDGFFNGENFGITF